MGAQSFWYLERQLERACWAFERGLLEEEEEFLGHCVEAIESAAREGSGRLLGAPPEDLYDQAVLDFAREYLAARLPASTYERVDEWFTSVWRRAGRWATLSRIRREITAAAKTSQDSHQFDTLVVSLLVDGIDGIPLEDGAVEDLAVTLANENVDSALLAGWPHVRFVGAHHGWVSWREKLRALGHDIPDTPLC